MSDRRTYTFGPLERRGILGPLHAGQAGLVAAGALAAIVALDASPSAGGALAGDPDVRGRRWCASFAPLGGRTAQEWAPVATAFALRRLSRRSRFVSSAPAGRAR